MNHVFATCFVTCLLPVLNFRLTATCSPRVPCDWHMFSTCFPLLAHYHVNHVFATCLPRVFHFCALPRVHRLWHVFAACLPRVYHSRITAMFLPRYHVFASCLPRVYHSWPTATCLSRYHKFGACLPRVCKSHAYKSVFFVLYLEIANGRLLRRINIQLCMASEVKKWSLLRKVEFVWPPLNQKPLAASAKHS